MGHRRAGIDPSPAVEARVSDAAIEGAKVVRFSGKAFGLILAGMLPVTAQDIDMAYVPKVGDEAVAWQNGGGFFSLIWAAEDINNCKKAIQANIDRDEEALKLLRDNQAITSLEHKTRVRVNELTKVRLDLPGSEPEQVATIRVLSGAYTGRRMYVRAHHIERALPEPPRPPVDPAQQKLEAERRAEWEKSEAERRRINQENDRREKFERSNERAKRLMATANKFEREGKFKAARENYQTIIKEHGDTTWANKAEEAFKAIVDK